MLGLVIRFSRTSTLRLNQTHFELIPNFKQFDLKRAMPPKRGEAKAKSSAEPKQKRTRVSNSDQDREKSKDDKKRKSKKTKEDTTAGDAFWDSRLIAKRANAGANDSNDANDSDGALQKDGKKQKCVPAVPAFSEKHAPQESVDSEALCKQAETPPVKEGEQDPGKKEGGAISPQGCEPEQPTEKAVDAGDTLLEPDSQAQTELGPSAEDGVAASTTAVGGTGSVDADTIAKKEETPCTNNAQNKAEKKQIDFLNPPDNLFQWFDDPEVLEIDEEIARVKAHPLFDKHMVTLVEDAGEDFEFGDASGDQVVDLEYFFAWLAKNDATATAASSALATGLDEKEEEMWIAGLEEELQSKGEEKTSGR